jgi:hypothetical protein
MLAGGLHRPLRPVRRPSSHRAKRHDGTYRDRLAARYRSVIVDDSVHRLSQNAGLQQQAIHRLVLRQRQDSGNLSSYEEIWSAKLVVGAYARAPRPH